MAKNNMTAFDILMSRSGRKTTGAKNTAQEDIQKIGSSANEFQNALISTLSQPSRATDGPAQVQTPSQPVQAPAIQTPELDSFRGNATGNTWEDTNALARQLDAEKARKAELQKTPERNVGGGLTTRQFEQTQDGSQGYVGRQAVGGLLSGTAEAANYFTNAALMAEPVEALTNTERLRNDATRQEDIDRVYQEYLSGLSRDERDALEITGTLPSREDVYAQRMMPEAQSEVDNVDLSRRYNWDLPYLAETEKRYEGVEIGAGKKLAGDVARTVGQMAPAMALNFIPGAGQVLSSAYLFSSAAGAAMNEALANGATNRQAMDYGDAVGLVELATEKMFDGLGGLLGKGAADDMVEGIIKSARDSGILKSNAGMNILRLSLGALGEGAEEVISDLVNPLITKITLEKDKKLDWSEVGYDALLGVLTGGMLGSVGIVNGQYKALNDAITSATAAEVLNDFATTEIGQQVTQNAEAIQSSPVGENTTQTQAPADDRLFHEPVNRSTANRILFDPEQRAAFEAETGVSLSNMSIRDAANLIMEYSRQSAETGQTGFDVAYPIKTPPAPQQFNRPLSRSEAQRVANDPTLRALFEQETGRTIPGKKYAVQFIQNVTAQLAEQANSPAAPTSPIAQTVLQNEAQQAQAPAPQEQTPAQQPAPAPIPAQNRAAPARPEGQTGQVRSISESNTVQAVDAQNNAPASVRQEIYYNPVSEDKSVSQARAMLQNGYQSTGPATPNTALTTEQRNALTAAGQRLGGGYGQAIADMQGAPVWTAVQQDMSLLMFNALAEDAKQTGDWSAYFAWRLIDQKHGEWVARSMQARGKATRGAAQDLMDYVTDTINSANLSEAEKNAAMDKAMGFAEEYKNIDKEDTASLIDLIKRVNAQRGTGILADKLIGGVGKLVGSNGWDTKILDWLLNHQSADFLSRLAEAQVKGLALDSTPVSWGDRIKTIQSIFQLGRVTTFLRNIYGNLGFGVVLEGFVQDVAGIAVDAAVSTQTGARSVGFNAFGLRPSQIKAAADALGKSILSIALDTDMGAISNNKYDPRPSTFRHSGNAAERLLADLSQILKYSLTSSDATFRGSLEAGTRAEIEGAKKNQGKEDILSQIDETAEKDAEYRLFQNMGAAASLSKGVHDIMNLAGFGGKRGTSGIQKYMRSGGFGLGDLAGPTYPVVPANLGVKPLEYSPLGLARGVYDLCKVIKSAKNSSVNLAQQRNAVMEISRGMAGVPLALLFATLFRAGIFGRAKDEDDYAVTKARESEGRKETQLNVDAAMRFLRGESSEWQEGDELTDVNYLEPVNAFMTIGALLDAARDDDDPIWKDLASNYFMGSWQAFMEMPVVDTLQSAFQSTQYVDEDNVWDKAGKFAETTAINAVTGMYPGMISAIANAMDPVARDTSGDTFMEQLANAMMNKTPLLREQLPEKLDSFGNQVENKNELYNALNALVSPGARREYAPNEIVQEWDKIYAETGKNEFYADYKAPNSFSNSGADYELTTAEKRAYQEYFTTRYNELALSAIHSDQYEKLTAEEKASVLSSLEAVARDEAKKTVVEGRGGDYQSDIEKVSDLTDIAGFYSTKAMLKDAAGNPNNRDYDRMPEILEAYGSLPEDVKEKLKAGGQTTGYLDELYDAWKGGVSAENWYKAYDAKADLEPYGDNKSVADWQKYQAMANVSSDKDMDVILRGYMQDSAYESYMTARNDGLSAKDWADARAAAGMLTPPEGKEDVPDALQYQAYAAVLDDKGMDAMMKAYLDKNAYEKYSVVRGLGVSAKDWADAWATTASLTPLDGKEDVADWQRYQAMASSASEKTMDAIFRSVMEDGMYARYTSARSGGVTPQQWADTRAAIAQLPILDGKKTIANWQGVNYIGSSKDLTDKEKDAMMALYFDKGQNGKFSTYDKYMACRAAGFKPQHLAKFYEFSCTYSKKADIIAAAVRYGFSQKNAEALYSMWQNGHW